MGLEGDVEHEWRQFPDLFHNLESLRQYNVSLAQLGMLYSNLVGNLSREGKLAFVGLQSEKERRLRKREFQKKTREFVSSLKRAVRQDADALPASLYYTPDRRHTGYVGGVVTIEQAIAALTGTHENALTMIGDALLAGSKKYVREVKGGVDTQFTPSLFKEYNLILYELKRKLDLKKNRAYTR